MNVCVSLFVSHQYLQYGISTCVCMYVYMYTCIHIHVHVYVCMCTFRCEGDCIYKYYLCSYYFDLSRDLASRNVLLSDELVAKVKLVHIPIDDDICYYEVAFPYF